MTPLLWAVQAFWLALFVAGYSRAFELWGGPLSTRAGMSLALGSGLVAWTGGVLCGWLMWVPR